MAAPSAAKSMNPCRAAQPAIVAYPTPDQPNQGKHMGRVVAADWLALRARATHLERTKNHPRAMTATTSRRQRPRSGQHLPRRPIYLGPSRPLTAGSARPHDEPRASVSKVPSACIRAHPRLDFLAALPSARRRGASRGCRAAKPLCTRSAGALRPRPAPCPQPTTPHARRWRTLAKPKCIAP